MNREEIFGVVRANMRRVMVKARGGEIQETMRLKDLVGDCLEVVEVGARSMKDLHSRVERDQLDRAKTVKDLVDLFENAAAEPAAR